MCGGNVEVIVIIEINEVTAVVWFVTEGQITRPPTVIYGHGVTERNDENFEEVSFDSQPFLKTFPLDNNAA
jgi:hypothetical protein